jgi:hypothetical protein
VRARSILLLVLVAIALAPSLAVPARADEPAIQIQGAAGTELSTKEEKEVRKTLSDYLAALQKQDYKKAGQLIDRPSLLAAVEPMVATIASDSLQRAAAMRKIFGVSTRDSIEARSNGNLFNSLMGYMMQVNPSAAAVLSKATIEVLAARKLDNRVHVAYRLTLPPAEPGGLPYEQITAQQMEKSDGKWRILFSLEQ